jgi:2-isopropylmalate synthase
VDPGLDFSDIDEIRRAVEHCNQLPVHPRHPYVGDLVYTSFSGSHQDAIKKAFAARKESDLWDMPYLPLDPKDLGRSYEAVIRVNSQSGKGGISYLLESEYGLELPRRLQIEFSRVVQDVMDASGKELTAQDLWELFQREYRVGDATIAHQVVESTGEMLKLTAEVRTSDGTMDVVGAGNGPIDAFVEGLSHVTGETIRVLDYHEHAVAAGADARAVAYLEIRVGERTLFGVGTDANIVSASFKAIVSGLQRAGLATNTSSNFGDRSSALSPTN